MKQRAAGEETCCLATFVIACFARVVAAHPEIQAYRAGFRKKTLVFSEVDVLMIIEKDFEGGKLPWFYTLRNCHRRSLLEIETVVQRHQKEPLYNSVFWRDLGWLTRQPVLVRRLVWRLTRYHPLLIKHFAGTVAVTSFGTFTKGGLAGLAISPMTLTLGIGSVDTRTRTINGVRSDRKTLKLSVSADHEVVDGAQGTRLIRHLQRAIASPDQFFQAQKN